MKERIYERIAGKRNKDRWKDEQRGREVNGSKTEEEKIRKMIKRKVGGKGVKE